MTSFVVFTLMRVTTFYRMFCSCSIRATTLFSLIRRWCSICAAALFSWGRRIHMIHIMRTVAAGNQGYATVFAANQKSYQTALDKLVQAYKDMQP